MQNYKTTAETLKREFEVVAPVKNVHLVRDLEGKSRGYAFVEMEDDSATRLVYSKMRGRTVDGADIFIDVERGRTVKDWRPRRLGNSNNTPRVDKPKKAVLKQIEAVAHAQIDRRDRRGPPGGGPREERRGGGGHFRGGRGGGGGGGYERERHHDRPREHDDYRGGSGRDGGGSRYDRRGDDYRGSERYERRDDRDSYERRR